MRAPGAHPVPPTRSYPPPEVRHRGSHRCGRSRLPPRSARCNGWGKPSSHGLGAVPDGLSVGTDEIHPPDAVGPLHHRAGAAGIELSPSKTFIRPTRSTVACPPAEEGKDLLPHRLPDRGRFSRGQQLHLDSGRPCPEPPTQSGVHPVHRGVPDIMPTIRRTGLSVPLQSSTPRLPFFPWPGKMARPRWSPHSASAAPCFLPVQTAPPASGWPAWRGRPPGVRYSRRRIGSVPVAWTIRRLARSSSLRLLTFRSTIRLP